jgi:hypothetical protein
MTEQHLIGLGRMTAAFNLLETFFGTLAGMLINARKPEIGQCITPHIRGFVALTKVIEALAAFHAEKDQRWSAERRSRLAALCRRARDLEQTRNAYTHSLWSDPQPGGNSTRMKLGPDGTFRFEDVEAPTIHKLADDLGTLGREVITLVADVFKDPSPEQTELDGIKQSLSELKGMTERAFQEIANEWNAEQHADKQEHLHMSKTDDKVEGDR